MQLDEAVGVVGGEYVPGQIRAGAEHRALAGQHDHARRPVVAGLLDRLPQLVDELGIQGIAALGTLQFDGHNGFGLGDADHSPSLYSLIA